MSVEEFLGFLHAGILGVAAGYVVAGLIAIALMLIIWRKK